MKNLISVLAGTVIVLAGCGEREQTVELEQLGQPVQEESAGMAAGVVGEQTAETVDQAVVREMEAVEAATSTGGSNGGSTGAETMESAGDAVEEVKGGVSESVAAAAGAAGAKLAGEAPAGTPAPADPVMADTTAAAQDTTAEVDLEQGKKIYTSNCFACHGAGVAGAPKLGDTANWAPRIAQGMEAMTTNAINGFQGTRGYMPAKGGFASLTDTEVTAAVAYMASESR